MKILEHADEIRRRLLTALEEAEQTPDPERRRFLQSVVVVGGGPAGCELAGSVNEMLRHAVGRDFKQLDPADCQVTLVDPGERLLRAMHPSLSEAAGRYLGSRGVKLLLGGRVKAIAPGRVTVSTADGEQTLEAATLCWTAGVRASHLGKLLAERSGASLDRGGRVIVEPDFSLPGHPAIRVVGDLCSYSHTDDGKALPGMAGCLHTPFRWTDFGSMAVIGPRCAVADLRGLRVSGPLGWLLWGLAHLAFMPASENRISLLTKWLWVIATQQRASLLITGRPDQHMGVEVGLEHLDRVEPVSDPATPAAVVPPSEKGG